MSQNEQELIDLLQQQLPEDLTTEQLAELRQMIRTSPAVREAMLTELRMEEGLAIEYAPPVRSFRALAEKFAHLAGQRARRQRFRLAILLACVLLVALAGLGTGAYFLHGGSTPERTSPASPNPGQTPTAPDTTEIAMGQTPPAPNTQPNANHGSAVAPPRDPQTRQPDGSGAGPTGRSPNPRKTPHPRFRLQAFQDTISENQRNWTVRADELLRRVDGRRLNRRDNYFEVDGRVQLLQPPTAQRDLRLLIDDASEWALVCVGRSRSVRFYWRSENPILALVGKPSGRDRHTESMLTADDGMRWEALRRGPFDLKWADGRIMLTRGEVLLVSLPMDQPPREVFLDLKGRLLMLQARPASPVPVRAEPSSEPSLPDWAGTGAWRASEEKLLTASQGQVALSCPDKTTGQAWLEVPAGWSGVVTLKIARADDGTGVWIGRDGSRSASLYVRHWRKRRVLAEAPDEDRRLDDWVRWGRVVPEVFWARLHVGLNHVRWEISPDGANFYRAWQGAHSGGAWRIGLTATSRKGPGTVVASVTSVTRFDRLTGRTDPRLRSRVPDHEAFTSATSLADLLGHIGPPPRDISAEGWRQAVAAKVLTQPGPPSLRWQAVRTIVLGAADSSVPFRTLADLLAEVFLTHMDSPERESWMLRLGLLDELALHAVRTRRPERLTELLDAWLVHFPETSGRATSRQPVLPVTLCEHLLLHLHREGDWKDLRKQAARIAFYQRDNQGRLQGDDAERHLIPLGHWADIMARSALADNPGDAPVIPREWIHPLQLEADRETLNTVAEFLALLDLEVYDRAGEVLTRRDLPDGLVSLGRDEGLFRSLHVQIRQSIEDHPDLRDEIQQRYSQAGMVRLRQAQRHGRHREIASLAAQFHGTEPGREALAHLADRDLVGGDFQSAIQRYRQLQAHPLTDSQTRQTAAKLRLAGAMMGQSIGEPITQDVQLPGGTLKAEQFESLVQDALTGHAGRSPARLQTTATATAPPAGKLSVRQLHTFTPDSRADRHGNPVAHAGMLARDGHVFLQQRGRLVRVDGKTGRTVWTYQPRFRDHGGATRPARPLVSGQRVFARLFASRDRQLVCLSGDRGEIVWRRSLHEGVISDPHTDGNWLYVLSQRRTRSNYLDVYLHRIWPDSGEVALSRRLFQVRSDPRELDAGELIASGDSLVFLAAGSLACCSRTGDLQWVRRLGVIPEQAWKRPGQRPVDPVRAGQTVIVAGQHSPQVLGVDLRSGALKWSLLRPRVEHVAGPVGNAILLAERDYIEAVDAATGRSLWQRDLPVNPALVLPARPNAFLVLEAATPARDTPNTTTLRATWLSASDGSPIASTRVAPGDGKLTNPFSLFTDGLRVYGLSDYDHRSRSAKLFALDPE